MDGRDVSMAMAREGTDKFVYTCNSCKSHVEKRYHCTVCEDFDLCVPCYEKGHPHKMEKLGLDSSGDKEARKLDIQRLIQSLVHSRQCQDTNCRLPLCQRMKLVVRHTKICKRKKEADCPVCKQLVRVCCYHAKHCQEAKCSVPLCKNIKQKLKQQQQKQQEQMKQLRQRMADMNTL